MKKVLFVGLGSIGQKHLNNLQKCGTFSIDALRSQKKFFNGIETVYTSYEEVPDDYDIIFITNPTNLHYEAISKLSNKTKNMFIEKPIYHVVKNIIPINGVCHVACPLRYSNVVKELQMYVKAHNVFAFRAICSSYLPDWRKMDYRNCYSSKSELGGGVELDLIHEIDYLKWIFGKFDNIKRISAKKSNLEINSNDYTSYLLENKKYVGSVHLDYFGRQTKREIEVFSEFETKVFDITKTKNDIYLDEMKYFLEAVEIGNKNCYNTPDEAIESLKAALV